MPTQDFRGQGFRGSASRLTIGMGLMFFIVFFITLHPSDIVGLGEPPDFSNKKKATILGQTNKAVNSDLPRPKKKEDKKKKGEDREKKKEEKEVSVKNKENIDAIQDLSEIEIISTNTNKIKDTDAYKKIKKKVDKLIRLKQFDSAYRTLQTISQNQLTADTFRIKKKLKLFQLIEKKASENVSMFGKDNALDEDIKQTVQKLYKEGQSAYLRDELEIMQDLLIQTLFLDRHYFKAKQLIKYGLQKDNRDYKIENLESKYWKTSLSSMYSGYPERAIKDLEVLAYFDPENALIFERMGSAYYSMGKPKDAIQSWKRALYLAPENKELGTFIINAEKESKRQDQALKEILSKKNKKSTKTLDKGIKMQVLGVYERSNVAYSFAQEVKEQLKVDTIIVEERADGKWEVKVPQTQSKKEIK
jgi:tetratricopeptide (TPR) repeat protein